MVGFVGTLAWLAIPGALDRAVGVAPLLAPIGMLLLAIVVPFLPFLQVRYALEGKLSALFSRRAIRQRFRCAPWAFAFSLFVLLLASIPLYLLKIEMIPPRGSLAAQPGLRHLPGAGTALDRLGVRSIRARRASAGM